MRRRLSRWSSYFGSMKTWVWGIDGHGVCGAPAGISEAEVGRSQGALVSQFRLSNSRPVRPCLKTQGDYFWGKTAAVALWPPLHLCADRKGEREREHLDTELKVLKSVIKIKMCLHLHHSLLMCLLLHHLFVNVECGLWNRRLNVFLTRYLLILRKKMLSLVPVYQPVSHSGESAHHCGSQSSHKHFGNRENLIKLTFSSTSY